VSIKHFKNYSIVTKKFTLDLNLSGLEQNFAKAQDMLCNQIIADATPFVPFRQGALSISATVENDDEIVYTPPYSRFQYMGRVMVDSRGSTWARKYGKKFVTARKLKYDKTTHPLASSHWYEKAEEIHKNEWIDLVKKVVKSR
jgi:hypothetical protein